MRANAFFQSVRYMSGRTPLIKFRQGRAPDHHQTPAAATSQSGKPGKPITTSAAIIEDWQLPARFRRRAISEEECLAINLGGAI